MDGPAEIVAIPALDDNYIYFVTKGSRTLVIDPGEASVATAYAEGKVVEAILCTHHHSDHIGGIEAMKRFGATLIGPKDVPGVNQKVKGGEKLTFLGETIEVIATPGHTKSYVAYYFPGLKVAFTGDTLFSGGCGKLFEGTAKEMHESLRRLIALPDETKLYFGHEYTRSNLAFGKTIEPENAAIVKALETLDIPTTPTTVEREKAINVFVRAKTAKQLGEIRAAKDAL